MSIGCIVAFIPSVGQICHTAISQMDICMSMIYSFDQILFGFLWFIFRLDSIGRYGCDFVPMGMIIGIQDWEIWLGQDRIHLIQPKMTVG